MSDLMLLGVLRMPIPDNPDPFVMMQFISSARQAADRIESDAIELERLRADSDRIQFLEDEVSRGRSPNIVFDDDGNCAVTYCCEQPAPRGGGLGYEKNADITCIVEPDEWRPSLRGAIDAAMRDEAVGSGR